MAAGDLNGVALVQHTHNSRTVDVPVLAAAVGEIYIQSKDLDFEHSGREKYLDVIKFDLESVIDVPLVKVYIGTRNSLKDDLVWTDLGYVDFNNPTVTCRLTSRFFTLKIVDESPIAVWKLSRIEFYGAILGLGRL